MLSLVYFLISVMSRQVASLNSYPIPLYMDEMLNSGRYVYDKQSTPTQNEGMSTKVNLSMYIEGLSSFRTQTMDFQVDVYFQQFWRDARLAHNESKRILIRDKKILDKMWHPDIYFANARIAEFHEVTQPNFLIWIERDGSILYDTRISMVVMCMMNLAKWPLDDQTCYLRILSYAYDVEQLQIAWSDNEPITRNPNIAMSDMHIVDLRPGICDGNYSTGVWSCVTAEFYVKREITHHVMQSYVPTTLIVVISWFSFWLDVEAVPARVSLAITTLLTLSTQANAARMALPEVSYMKAIDVWMGTCMMFVFGVMIEFTIVNYAQRQGIALDSANSSKRDKKTMSKSESVASSFGQCAREILNKTFKLSHDQHHHLIEQFCEDDDNELAKLSDSSGTSMVSSSRHNAPSYHMDEHQNNNGSSWRDSEREAERLANWTHVEHPLPERDASPEREKWSRLLQNGTAGNYGSRGKTAPPKKKGDRWVSTIKQLKHNKKISARNEAKRIDQKSRWAFPLSFLFFNLSYWTYYLYLV
ncbi:hypothetical protein QR680_019229 [Steinernema hermaphroditum]|uniref:Uncharacterized protein n=1 Tax=Steinernema hermaphroditum TaxID=289476 RepID=A0AA39LRJ6_9BILA|nr:hypothetical protein QR680_019229 [Steinernema hermaphroditum]